MLVSSPRTRGLSGAEGVERAPVLVVPAHAGVIRPARPAASGGLRRPRARGGYPNWRCPSAPNPWSSPRTRGLSDQVRRLPRRPDVVPAHAGVIRARPQAARRRPSRPRARGGYPSSAIGTTSASRSSPRTRGLSVDGGQAGDPALVVPAHAGVIRPTGSRSPTPTGRPRARGGYPYRAAFGSLFAGSSPRTRGLSGHPRLVRVHLIVVPAHAGVIR